MKNSKNLLGLVLGLLAASSSLALKLDGNLVTGYVNAYSHQGSEINSFGFLDGSVRLSDKIHQVDMLLEIPVVYSESSPPSNRLALSGDVTHRGQAYFGVHYANGFYWRLGKFESLFGIESKKAAERDFVGGGVVSSLSGDSNQGLLVGYAASDLLSLEAVLSNPADEAMMKNGKPSFSFKVSAIAEDVSFYGGAFFQSSIDEYTHGSEKEYKADFGVLIRRGDFKFGSEILVARLPYDDSDTSAGAALYFSFYPDKKWDFNLRGEFLHQAYPTFVGDDKFTTTTASVRYALTEAVKLSLDAEYIKVDADAPISKVNELYLGVLAARYTF